MPQPSNLVARFALTAAIGAAGGGLFALLALPVAWLSGAMVAVTAVTIGGFRPYVPSLLRDAVFILLGITIGAGVTPEALQSLSAWPISLIALLLSIPACMVFVIAYLRRSAGWDEGSAFFASAPGALSYVLALSLQSRADTRRVALAQSVRLFILVALLPTVIVWTAGSDFAMPLHMPEGSLGGGVVELGVLVAAGLVGGYLGQRLRVPGGYLVGAMIASAVLHGTGLVGMFLPDWLLLPGLVLLGAVIGQRFEGADLKLIRATIGPSLGAFMVAAFVAVIFALLVSWGLDIPLGQTLLAFAPGGVEAMTIMAFMLNLDPAYVGAHHVARFLGLSLALPFWARPYMKR